MDITGSHDVVIVAAVDGYAGQSDARTAAEEPAKPAEKICNIVTVMSEHVVVE